jgi:hypothetical protein
VALVAVICVLPFVAMNMWQNRAMRNFHLPLPEQTYTRLRAEAKKAQVPATTLAREAIDWWLKVQARKARSEAITAFAAKAAGTDWDLDPAWEAAGIESLLKAVPK